MSRRDLRKLADIDNTIYDVGLNACPKCTSLVDTGVAAGNQGHHDDGAICLRRISRQPHDQAQLGELPCDCMLSSDRLADELSFIVTLASTAANYSGQSVELLEEAEEINLKKQLSILLDPKYKSQADWNMEYREAIEAASMNLHVLKEQGEEKEREVKNVLETLIRVSCRSFFIYCWAIGARVKISVLTHEFCSSKPTQAATWLASSI